MRFVKCICLLLSTVLLLCAAVKADEAGGCEAAEAALNTRVKELTAELAAVKEKVKSGATDSDAYAKSRANLEAAQKECQNQQSQLREKMQQAAAESETKLKQLQEQLATGTQSADVKGKEAEEARAKAEKLVREKEELQKQLEKTKATIASAEDTIKESKELKGEVVALKQQLEATKNHWLPLWSHPHYDTYIAPVDKIYREEVASGRVLQRSASAGSAAYKQARTYVVPTLQRSYTSSRSVIDPAYEYTSKTAQTATRAVNKHLEHPRYKTVMTKVRAGNKAVRKWTKAAQKHAKSLYNHSKVKEATRAARKQLQRTEADLQRIITRVLKADVKGSGIEPEFVQGLARGVLYGMPLVLVLYFLRRTLFSRKRQVKPAVNKAKTKPKSSSSRSKSRR